MTTTMLNNDGPAHVQSTCDITTGILSSMSISCYPNNFSHRSPYRSVCGVVTDYQLGMESGKGYWKVEVRCTAIDFRVELSYRDGPSDEAISDLQVTFRLDSVTDTYGVNVPVLDAHPFVRSNAETVEALYQVAQGELLEQFLDGIVINGALVVRVELSFDKESWYAQRFKSHVGGAFLRRNASELFFSKRHSDFTLVSSDEREHKVHRCILDAGSPVFRAMFDTNMSEKLSGRTEITDIDGPTLDALLQFLYGIDVTPALGILAEDLLIAADKYQIPDLKIVCASYLSLKVEAQNAARLLILADEMCMPLLTDAALRFIGGNFAAFKSAGGMDHLKEHDDNEKLTMILVDYLGNSVENTRKRTAAEAGLN